MKKFFFLALSLTAVGLLISFLRPPFFEVVEGKLHDIHFALRGPIASSGRVVLVTIDEKSLQQLGRWPWPRRRFAQIFAELEARGARVIAPDIFFAEPSPGVEGQKDDLLLAHTFAKNPNIFLGYFLLLTPEELQESSANAEQLKENFENTSDSALPFELRPVKIRKALGIQDTLALFSRLVHGGRQGYFNILPDPDGTVRSASLLFAYRDKIFPSLSLQIAMNLLNRIDLAFLSGLRLDPHGDFLINYRGLQSFARISAVDLLEKTQTVSFKDKVVLFGATAAGLEDNRPTPVDSTTPSVILTAHIVDNLIQGDFLRQDSLTDLVSRLLILVVGGVMAILLARMDPAQGFFLFLSLTLIQALSFHLGFVHFRWMLQNIYPLFSGFLVYGGTTLARYLIEEKEKRFINETFQHYLSSDVIRELTEHPEKVRLGGERKELTVLFSDIRDFATIVETTPPEVLVALLNSYLTPVTDIILDHKGLLDKYIGDAVMAVFGAPLPEPNHPRLACESAVKTIQLVKASQEKWRHEFNVPALKIGIGINTGVMTVGNMGSERRFDYTVMGDAVNLASRLEGLNKFYGTNLLVSHTTYEQVRDLFPFRELDSVQVKGKKATIRIYELLVDLDATKEKILLLFAEALELYRAGKFGPARSLFEKCLELDPQDGPSRLFVERCREYEAKPPTDWAGTTAFLKK